MLLIQGSSPLLYTAWCSANQAAAPKPNKTKTTKPKKAAAYLHQPLNIWFSNLRKAAPAATTTAAATPTITPAATPKTCWNKDTQLSGFDV
jgi:hypothetical protein